MLANSQTADSTIDPLIGSVLDGRYRVRRVIGEGGMGIVYEGEHTLIERPVAIKVLREDFCRRPDAVERFRREAKSASRIGHPNIVDVLDFGETPSGASYFVMEMLKGQDLADLLAQGGSLAPERAVLIAYQCCNALAAAHDKGIVHRDLKPENIFLIEREGFADFVKIVDFGVAKMTDLEFDLEGTGTSGRARLTRTGMIFGTPEYMSPEQAAGHQPDHRVDIYALGITLYELLTGRVPFEGETFMSVLSKHANKQLPALRDVNPRVKLSPPLENVIFHALRKERNERFQHMRDMAAALELVPEMPASIPFRLSQPSNVTGVTRTPVAPPTPVPSEPAISGTAPALRGGAAMSPVTRSVSEVNMVRPPRSVFAAGLIAAALVGVGAVYAASGHLELVSRGRAGLRAGQAALTAPAGLPEANAASAANALPTGASVSGTAPALRGGAPSGTAPALRGGAPSGTAPALRGGASLPVGEDATLELVTVRVTTEPSGASVKLADGETVCASTPCAFDAVSGKAISLLAQRGAWQATTNLKPTAATDLHLVLNGKPKKPASPTTTPPRVVARHDDLKVPAMFQNSAR